MRLTTRAILLVAIPIAAEIISFSTLYVLFKHVREGRSQALHSADLVSKMNALQMLATERNVALITQSVVGGDPSRKIPGRIEEQSRLIVCDIDRLVKGHPEEEEHWTVIKSLADDVEHSLVLAGSLYKKDETTQAKLVMARAEQSFAKTFRHMEQMCAVQRQNQSELLVKQDQHFDAIERALITSVLASIFLAFSLLIYFNRTTSDRLRRLIANATDIGRGLEPQYQVSGTDELGQLHETYSQMYRDLTRIRERERDILERAAEGIASFSGSFLIEECNPAFANIFHAAEASLVGTHLEKLVGPDTFLEIAEGFQKAHHNEHSKCTSSFEREGHSQVIEWSASWSQTTERYNCIVLDISEQVELARLKSEFVAMISHDLRSPLTAVQLAHEFLEAEHLSEDGAITLQESTESIGRLLALVNNLLDLDKLENANYVLNSRIGLIKPILEDAHRSSRLLAEQCGIQVFIEVDPDLTARFDAERLLQVLYNLLSNALKFSQPGTKITLSARAAGNMALIQVDDEGSGIPDSMLETVFERYKQVNPIRDSQGKKGSGLGLAICKAIIESHGGQIWASQRKPQGSSFCFTLPLI